MGLRRRQAAHLQRAAGPHRRRHLRHRPADFDFDLALADLALLSERASGRLTAKGRAKGSDGLIGLTFGAEVPEGTLVGKT